MSDDDDKRRVEVTRGQQAGFILEHDLWAESWATLEDVLLNEWRSSKPEQEAKREHIYTLLHAGRGARKYIEQIFQTGTLAERQLKELRK